MSKKKNIKPSIDEAKLRIKMYKDLSAKLSGLSLEETRIVLEEMDKYVKLIFSNVRMEHRLFLVYTECVDILFEYFYKTRLVTTDKDDIDPEMSKHVDDVLITIFKEHDAS